MHLAAVSIVRSECDIIERFVRHNAAFFDRLYILDHRSTDTTPDILRKLADEGLPLELSREGYGIFYQGPSMTHLIKRAFDDHPWDFIFHWTATNFFAFPIERDWKRCLQILTRAASAWSEVLNYVPTKSDDLDESDVLRRIVHRAKTIPDISHKMGKVVIPGAVIKQPGFSLNEGHHGVCINGKPVPERWVDGLSLAHFPIRSIDQFILRTILCRLAWSSRSDYNPSWGWHYGTFFKQLKVKPAVSAADLTEAALLYVDIYIEPGETPHQKVLVREPVSPAYDRLRFTNPDDMAVLPPVLDMMEFVVDELRAARMMSPGHAAPVALAAQTSVSAVGIRWKRADTNASPSARHTFQSFWHGGVLSPYELFCLKSFIDCGHAVDLYTYDLNLVAPAGVRVCDAAELVGRDEVFVYQSEGFGKGSPSAFSNHFRYKLLAERGGWWIDTDVVCLTDRIPVVERVFRSAGRGLRRLRDHVFPARPPDHAAMPGTDDQARPHGQMGRYRASHADTRASEGRSNRAVPASVSYPIHYSQAVDLLRPSKTAVLAPGSKRLCFFISGIPCSFIVGVQKNLSSPKGSLLRSWMDKHPVDGWTGEYDDATLEGALM